MTRLAAVLATTLAVGCSCNQDYSFPPVEGQTFDPPTDFGSWLAMRTAPDGQRLTISYYDRDRTGFGFAVGTPQADDTVVWVHERIDGYPDQDGIDRGDRGKYGTHQVAPDGTVYAAYQDTTNGALRGAIRRGTGNWEHVQIDAGLGVTSSNAGNWIAMTILPNGLPLVAHADLAGNALRVSRLNESGTWETESARTGTDVGRYAAMTSHGDQVYLAYYSGTTGDLELLEGNYGSWTHSVVDNNGDVGQWPSLWADADELVIAYHDVGNQDLKLARRIGGSWNRQVIDDGAYRGADSALFLREDGLPAIAYFDGQNNDIWLATTDGAAWSRVQVAGDNGAVGFHTEVASAGGRWWVASYDFTARTLFIQPI